MLWIRLPDYYMFIIMCFGFYANKAHTCIHWVNFASALVITVWFPRRLTWINLG